MRKLILKMHNETAAFLEEIERGYLLEYIADYDGQPLSLALPVEGKTFEFSEFPPFLDGLLPEGYQLDALLRKFKIDEEDYFSQILVVGKDLVGAITVEEA